MVQIPTYLDAQEERKRMVEILKDKMIVLVSDYVDTIGDDHPARIEKNKEEAQKLWNEICWRKQDFDILTSDYKADWDLNYDDYDV